MGIWSICALVSCMQITSGDSSSSQFMKPFVVAALMPFRLYDIIFMGFSFSCFVVANIQFRCYCSKK